MQFIPIPPMSLQNRFIRPYLFGLAHLLDNQSYGDFFFNRAESSYTILDNACYELKQPLEIDRLVALAVMHRFHELILPDQLWHDKETLLLTVKAMVTIKERYPEFAASNTRFMLVPQGRSPYLWGICGRMLLEQHELIFGNRPVTIGVPKVTSQFVGGRQNLIDRHLMRMQEDFDFDIHFLGISENFAELKWLSYHYGAYIRTIDSARPFVFAYAGFGLSPLNEPEKYPGRPEGYFDLESTEQLLVLAQQNVGEFERLFAHEDPRGVDA